MYTDGKDAVKSKVLSMLDSRSRREAVRDCSRRQSDKQGSWRCHVVALRADILTIRKVVTYSKFWKNYEFLLQQEKQKQPLFEIVNKQIKWIHLIKTKS